MDELIIRKATLTDIDTLRRLEQGVINAERPFDNTLKSGDIEYYNLEDMLASENIEVIVAETEGSIIGSGYARIENAKPYLQHLQHAYLGFMFVEQSYRGKGVNQRIIEALTIWTRSKNITEMRLDVYHDNIAAIKAYEKAGFRKLLINMRMGL